MIRINRNHPSVIVWSMDNEVFFSSGQVMPKVRSFLKDLVAYSHELDPTRPAAIGGSQRGGIDKLGDVAGYNGDGARLFVKPGIPSVVTEYGSTIADRPGKFEPGWGDLPSTPGTDKNVVGSWRLPWRSGEENVFQFVADAATLLHLSAHVAHEILKRPADSSARRNTAL
jgi:beta-galactosidase